MQLQIKPIQVYLIIWMLQLFHENLHYSLLIFSVILEENLQVTNDELSLLR